MLSVVRLNAIRLNAIRLNAIRLNVVRLSVVAPLHPRLKFVDEAGDKRTSLLQPRKRFKIEIPEHTPSRPK
jgi:hypothetical protein